MIIRKFLVIATCVGLLMFFGLACCCPMAFPMGDWSQPVNSSPTQIAVPNLDVTYPVEGEVTESSQIEVAGFTDSDATLTVNGKTMTVYSDGSFKGVVDLNPGENKLIFSAIRSGGDPAILEIGVTSNCST